MTESKKMTDDEIIRELEYKLMFAQETHRATGLSENLIKNTIDLINRQKADNEKLKRIEHFATKTVEKQEKEIERLNGCVKSEDEVRAIATETIQTCIKIIKVEAIKEFSEKLKKDKQRFRDVMLLINWKDWFDEAIDYELKEMVGETE